MPILLTNIKVQLDWCQRLKKRLSKDFFIIILSKTTYRNIYILMRLVLIADIFNTQTQTRDFCQGKSNMYVFMTMRDKRG